MWYKGAPLHLPKMMKPQAKLDKVKTPMSIQYYEQLASFVYGIHDSYSWLYKSLDVMVRTHMLSSIGSLNEAKYKNRVSLEINEYMEQLR